MGERGELTGHCCRTCMSGILKRDAGGFQCCGCLGPVAEKVEEICGCGLPGFRGLARCGPNTNPTPENAGRLMIHVGSSKP